MNDFTEIDLRSWKRRPKFEYYRTFQNQLVNLTVELDASALYHCAKSWGVSFFLLTLYAVLRAVDSVPQLRQRILPDGRVIEFRHTAVLTPVMAGEEEFSMALAEYAGTFDEFRKQAEPAVAAAKRGEFDPEVRERLLLRELCPVVQFSVVVTGGVDDRSEHCDSCLGASDGGEETARGGSGEPFTGGRDSFRSFLPGSRGLFQSARKPVRLILETRISVLPAVPQAVPVLHVPHPVRTWRRRMPLRIRSVSTPNSFFRQDVPPVSGGRNP